MSQNRETEDRLLRSGVTDAVLVAGMNYFMAHEGVVDALAQRRETGAWPDA